MCTGKRGFEQARRGGANAGITDAGITDARIASREITDAGSRREGTANAGFASQDASNARSVFKSGRKGSADTDKTLRHGKMNRTKTRAWDPR